MSPDIDLARLSLRDTLDLAIFVEEEARQRYLELVEQIGSHHTREAADFFTEMAASEVTHAERLRTRRRAIFGDSEVNVDRSLAFEIEGPEYHQVRAFMTVHEALEVALESERKAYRFYDRALQQVEDADVRLLFEDLREQEVQHQQQILAFKDRLPAEDGADPDDYVDEPQPM
jgi:rubrerythrin